MSTKTGLKMSTDWKTAEKLSLSLVRTEHPNMIVKELKHAAWDHLYISNLLPNDLRSVFEKLKEAEQQTGFGIQDTGTDIFGFDPVKQICYLGQVKFHKGTIHQSNLAGFFKDTTCALVSFSEGVLKGYQFELHYTEKLSRILQSHLSCCRINPRLITDIKPEPEPTICV